MTENFDEVTTQAESDGNRLDAELRWLGYALLICFVVGCGLFIAVISAISNLLQRGL